MDALEKQLRDELNLRVPEKGRLNYSIQAGAGGGKSTMLSVRICNQIISGTEIEKFVIITYTNAAANELRDKIADELQKVKGGSHTDLEKSRADEALKKIELIQISTIHAFLLKILKENAFETGIALDVKMLEEEDNKKRREEFYNNWYKNNSSYVNNFELLHTQKDGKTVNISSQAFEKLFHDIADVREEIVYDLSDHTAVIDRHAAGYINYWLPRLKILRDEIVKNVSLKKDKKPSSYLKLAKNVVFSVAEVEEAVTAGNVDAQKAGILSEAVGSIANIAAGDGLYHAEPKTNMDVQLYAEELCRAMPEWEMDRDFGIYLKGLEMDEKINRMVEAVCKLQMEYQKLIDSKTQELSNNDILYRAELLLNGHRDILDKQRAKYDKIYVDEFQDTTGLQTSIIKMLCERVGTEPGSEDFQEDKLLVVGDPKQSIYRFTGAEKAIYDEVNDMMGNRLPDRLARAEILKSNFRSNEDIVGWVNGCFDKLMGAEYSPMDSDWSVLEKNALHGVYKYTPANIADEGAVIYDEQADVEATLELVKTLVGNPEYFIEERKRGKDGLFKDAKLRRIRYSDFMIITRNTYNIEKYKEAFSAEGIPVNVQAKFSVGGDAVLKNFAALVDYFGSPRNKKKRIIAEQVMTGIDITGIEEFGDILDKIGEYIRENELDVASTVRYLMTREELYFPKERKLELAELRSFRIHLHQMVESCLANNSGGLGDLAVEMDRYMNGVIQRENSLESSENAVRLMNVHQAKGLTGQIVIIADRTNDEKCKYSGFRKAGKYYPVLRYKVNKQHADEHLQSFCWDLDMLRQVYKDEADESIRLQYVAATRAAHALIIMPVASKKAVNCWFSNERYCYDKLPDINEWIEERNRDTKNYPAEADSDVCGGNALRLADLEKSIAGADFEEGAKSQLISISPSGLEPEGETGYSSKDGKLFRKENRPSASGFGTVMHRVYELIFKQFDSLNELNEQDLEKALGRIINRAILEKRSEFRDGDKPEQFAEYLGKKMHAYFHEVIAKIMVGKKEIYQEYTFSFYLDNADREKFRAEFNNYLAAIKNPIEIKDEPVWINGIADLVVKYEDNSVKVYDYKSDAMNGKPKEAFEEAVAKKYEGQLALYKYAIGKAFGVDSVDAEIIHLYRL